MSARLGDFDAARHGARRILELVPGDPDATWLLENADQIEAATRAPGARGTTPGTRPPDSLGVSP